MESIIENRIRLSWPKLTAREREIAEQMLKQKLDLRAYSITRLAKTLSCSVSMINRLTHKLGYDGFKDLHAHAKAATTLLDKYGESLTLLQRDAVYSIAATENALNYEELSVIAKHIFKTRKIIFYGEAFTFLIAEYFAHLFNKIGIETKVMNIASDIALINNAAAATNIFISISGRNPNLELAYAKATFNALHAFSALITGNLHALLAKQVNVLIEVHFHLSLAINPFELPLTSKLAIDYVLLCLFTIVYEQSTREHAALIQQIAKEKV